MGAQLGKLEVGAVVGEFRIEELYPEGRGGMARVVRATPRSRRGRYREVALKIARVGLNDQFYRQALKDETVILEKLRGVPGVVQILPTGSPRGAGLEVFVQRALELEGQPWFFAMECLNGGKLESYAKAVGPLPVVEAASLATAVSRTLHAVHSRGFVHNDVKPDNILFRHPLKVGQPFQPVLIDFGIAAKLKRLQDAGTTHYMAPERLLEARGDVPPEAARDPTKADVWAVGILVYRMLVGREPFNGLTPKSLTSAILRATPAAMRQMHREIPAELDAYVIEACLAKDPRARPTMQEVGETLERFGHEVPVSRLPRRAWRPW